MFTLGLIVVASLGTVSQYVLENIKVKSDNGINPKMYNRFNGKEYYSADTLRQTINATK
ncbi:hypothetical protein ShirakiTB12_23950 [Priestia megaterium]|uniref:Uncharacterized protein n=1 Tax=Priestia megaterium TaxID=1404 RepID=A0AAX6BJP4_PRIMG|nr:hypothetical protein ShirakiTB12_23950 [Priestia megaterium]